MPHSSNVKMRIWIDIPNEGIDVEQVCVGKVWLRDCPAILEVSVDGKSETSQIQIKRLEYRAD